MFLVFKICLYHWYSIFYSLLLCIYTPTHLWIVHVFSFISRDVCANCVHVQIEDAEAEEHKWKLIITKKTKGWQSSILSNKTKPNTKGSAREPGGREHRAAEQLELTMIWDTEDTKDIETKITGAKNRCINDRLQTGGTVAEKKEVWGKHSKKSETQTNKENWDPVYMRTVAGNVCVFSVYWGK